MYATIIIVFVIVSRTTSKVCNYQNSVELTNRSYNGIKYGTGEYFVDNKTGVKRGCVCKKERCVRKCCPMGEGYHLNEKKCVSLPDKFDPPVWEGNDVKPGFNISKDFHFLLPKMNCSQGQYRISIRNIAHNYYLQTNGKLHLQFGDENQLDLMYGPNQYCIDNFIHMDDENSSQTIILNGFICYTLPEKDGNTYVLSASCMLISCFFIILTVAVYAFLPELRTKVEGMIMMAYLLSFFVGFLFMATMQILLMVDKNVMEVCTSMTFVIYFAVLTGFFWQNVMCYDLWGKFRMNITPGSLHKKILCYCAYAFGMPTALTILVAALEFSGLPHDYKLLPHIRTHGCFFYGISRLLYLYSPMLILCAINLVFFILITRRLSQITKQTTTKTKNTQRFLLYIKLFFVTGVTWIFEVISVYLPEYDHIWQFTDAYNSLVGLVIFLIFVCQKKTWKLIKIRYRRLTGKSPSRMYSNSTVSSPSQSRRDQTQMISKT